jgi:hypothetical protein
MKMSNYIKQLIVVIASVGSLAAVADTYNPMQASTGGSDSAGVSAQDFKKAVLTMDAATQTRIDAAATLLVPDYKNDSSSDGASAAAPAAAPAATPVSAAAPAASKPPAANSAPYTGFTSPTTDSGADTAPASSSGSGFGNIYN